MDIVASKHFLLVEDNEDHAYLTIQALKKESSMAISVDWVDDGEKALKYLRKQGAYTDCMRPDVVLLDLKLPKYDGHEVLAEVKSDSELKSIPVVVLSTSNAQSDVHRAYDQYVNSYVVKPLDFSSLRELITVLSKYWMDWNQTPI